MRTTFLLSVALFCPLAAWTADDVKPFDVKLGLWESTTTTQISGIAMPAMPAVDPETLAKMPPAVRAQLEQAMAGRGGMGGGRPIVTKSCMTRESLSRAMVSGEQKNCTKKLVTSTSSKQEVHLECSQNGMKMTGDMTLERVDAEHYKADATMKTPQGERQVDVKLAIAGKWLSSDCGSVKPDQDK